MMDYSPVRKNIYGNALKVAYTRLQVMQRQGIQIRSATISSIQSILKKYKANGGGNEYDNINKLLTPQK